MECKRMLFAGFDDFKLIQEVHMGLGTTSNHKQKHLTVKYGQRLKRESNLSKKLKFWGYSHPNQFLARQQLLEIGGKTFMKSKHMTFKNVKESRFLDIPSKGEFDIWKVVYMLPRVQIQYAKLFQRSKRLRTGQNSSKGL